MNHELGNLDENYFVGKDLQKKFILKYLIKLQQKKMLVTIGQIGDGKREDI